MIENKFYQTNFYKYSQKLLFSTPYTTQSKSTYQYGKVEHKKNKSQWPVQYILKTINNVEINKKVQQRLRKLQEIPQHDNIVPVRAKGFKTDQKQVFILSDYLQDSESIQSIVKKDIKLKTSQLAQIFYQIIHGMLHLQKNGINHLRLNPSSILIKFSQYAQSPPIVRICDMGVAKQNTYFYQWCLHRDYFEQNNKLDPYEMDSKICTKYDIWAFGCIIFYLLKRKQPFYGKQSKFMFGSYQLVFKEKHVKNYNQWCKNKQYCSGIEKQYWFERLLPKCWGLEGSQKFSSWTQIAQFVCTNGFIKTSQLQKIQIFSIFKSHIIFIFLLSNIYIILREQCRYKTSIIWQSGKSQQIKNNQQQLKGLSQYIFKIQDFYHCGQFQKYFKHKCSILPHTYKQMLNKISQYIINQRQFLKSSQIIQKKEPIQGIFQGILQKIVSFKTIFKEVKNSVKSQHLKILNLFTDQLILKLKEANKILKNQDRNRYQFINVMYTSQKFNDMAYKQFGFQFKQYDLFKDQNY